MATMLDRPTQTTQTGYPPEVENRMRMMGIWPPGRYPVGSKQANVEADLLANILSQYQRGQELDETRQYRKDIHDENLAQRKAVSEQTQAYRDELIGQREEASKSRRTTALQFLYNDPNLSKDEKAAVKKQMLESANVNVPLTPTTTATKGEFGPGGAPAPAPTNPADVFSGTPMSTAGGGGGTPEAPRPLARYFQPSRYTGSGLSASQMARAASNLDRAQAADEAFNMLQYRNAIGGNKFADIYGTSDPSLIKPGMPPADVIPQLYGGEMKIPEVSKVGYYDSKGNFISPLYSDTGARLPMPKGATGIRGTASLPGVTETAGGGGIVAPEHLKPVIAGRVPVGGTPAEMGAQTAAASPELSNQIKAMETPAGGYTPPTAAFAAAPAPAPAPPTTGGGLFTPEIPTTPIGPPTSNFSVGGGFTPEAAAFLGQFINLPKLPSQRQPVAKPAVTPPNLRYSTNY